MVESVWWGEGESTVEAGEGEVELEVEGRLVRQSHGRGRSGRRGRY
jgi:hypothetical protein